MDIFRESIQLIMRIVDSEALKDMSGYGGHIDENVGE